MLFEIESDRLKNIETPWTPNELELEKYLITELEGIAKILDASIFGDELLLIGDEIHTNEKKRVDIFAIDKHGNGVVIELKKEKGMLGVDTQALQYLADFSKYKGENFIKHFGKKSRKHNSSNDLKDAILGFIGDNADIESINIKQRIILMAKSFDPALFSMGEWLSSNNVAFRCITYTPYIINERKFLSFSVVFDKAPGSLFPLSFSTELRNKKVFWHNIARNDNEWWHYLVEKSVIPACFENDPNDQGYKILNNYIEGDIIIAYAKEYGAVGWGEIGKNKNYVIFDIGGSDDKLEGDCRHRISIEWKAVARNLEDGLRANIIRKKYHIYHPVSTSVTIDKEKSKPLIKELNTKFNS
jgi:uncharacterized protein YejL (UPF0352 family)